MIHFDENRQMEFGTGYKPPETEHRKMRASMINVQTLRARLLPNEPPVYSEKQLIDILNKTGPINYLSGAPKQLILNQHMTSGCTGYSGAGGLARQIWIRSGGKQVLRLSGAFLYDQINGGRDQGSYILDSQTALQRVGTVEEDVYPDVRLRVPTPPAGATLYTEDVLVTCSGALEIATLLTMGILPQAPVSGGEPGFSKFDGDGFCYMGGSGRGNADHSVYFAALEYVNCRLAMGVCNSWDLWGPFGEGWARMSMKSVDATASVDDGYGHASTPEAL